MSPFPSTLKNSKNVKIRKDPLLREREWVGKGDMGVGVLEKRRLDYTETLPYRPNRKFKRCFQSLYYNFENSDY